MENPHEYLIPLHMSLNDIVRIKRFLSLKVFRLLSSSLLLFLHFSQCVLRPSLGVCQTQQPTWNYVLY